MIRFAAARSPVRRLALLLPALAVLLGGSAFAGIAAAAPGKPAPGSYTITKTFGPYNGGADRPARLCPRRPGSRRLLRRPRVRARRERKGQPEDDVRHHQERRPHPRCHRRLLRHRPQRHLPRLGRLRQPHEEAGLEQRDDHRNLPPAVTWSPPPRTARPRGRDDFTAAVSLTGRAEPADTSTGKVAG